MAYLQADNVTFAYESQENRETLAEVLHGVTIHIERENLLRFWDITEAANRRWPSSSTRCCCLPAERYT